MAKFKTKTELEAENKILRSGYQLDAITKVVKLAIIVGGLMYCFDVARDIAIEWSGKDTNANILVIADLQASANLNNTDESKPEATNVIPAYSWMPGLLGFILGLMGISYGMAESKARRDIIERFHPYQVAWEKENDSDRTTSKLTKRGDTHPEDV